MTPIAAVRAKNAVMKDTIVAILSKVSYERYGNSKKLAWWSFGKYGCDGFVPSSEVNILSLVLG
jgi:hypothetical protein